MDYSKCTNGMFTMEYFIILNVLIVHCKNGSIFEKTFGPPACGPPKRGPVLFLRVCMRVWCVVCGGGVCVEVVVVVVVGGGGGGGHKKIYKVNGGPSRLFEND